MDAPLLAETDMDRPQRPHAASTDSADIAYASAVAAPPLSHSYSQAQMQRTAEDLGGDDDTKWSSAKRGPKSRRMSWRKLCLQLGVLWLAVFAIGLIADRLVYGQPFVLHTQASMSAVACATPLVMVLLCWDSLSAWLLGDPTDDELCTPARRRRIERRDAGLRVLWAISVFFLMFILVHNFALAHFATTDEQTFFFSEAMRHMMTERPLDDDCGRDFTNIRDREDFWAYMKGPFVNGLYPSDDPFVAMNGLCRVPEIHKIRSLRLRQLRVKDAGDHCLKVDANVRLPCFLPLSANNLDRSPYPNATLLGQAISNITTCPLETGWTYSDNAYLTQARRTVKPLPVFGPTRTAHYPPGGHTLHMPNFLTRTQAMDVVNFLAENDWVDIQTRFVAIEYASFNINIRRWLITRILFEFMAGGLVVPDLSQQSIGILEEYMVQYDEKEHFVDNEQDYIYFQYVQVNTFIIYLLVECILKVITLRFSVVTRFYFWLDMALIGAASASWLYYLSGSYYYPALLSDMGTCRLDDYSATGFLWQTSRDIAGILVILLYLKVVRYMMLVPGLDVIPMAMFRAMPDMALFLVTFMMIFLGFAMGFFIIYSADVSNFNSIRVTLLTLWQTLLGQLDITDFTQTRAILGAIIFVVFSFLMLFFLVSFLVTISGDSFQDIKRINLTNAKRQLNLQDRREQDYRDVVEVSHYNIVQRYTFRLLEAVGDISLRHKVMQSVAAAEP